jgi:hypothetical protein
MAVFNDPRLDPVDINNSPDFFPRATTPEMMALHMTRQWQSVHPTDRATLQTFYDVWLKAYRQIDDWLTRHPSATPKETASEAETIVAGVFTYHGIPRRGQRRRSAHDPNSSTDGRRREVKQST